MSYIYSVIAISLEEYTEERLKKLHASHNCLYSKQLTFEEFLKFQKQWKEDSYDISSFVSSYHLEYKTAKEYVEGNVCDINEAGCYNYAAISKIPIDATYYNSCQNPNTDFDIYKYNIETKEYELLDKKAKEYEYLIRHVWGCVRG